MRTLREIYTTEIDGYSNTPSTLAFALLDQGFIPRKTKDGRTIKQEITNLTDLRYWLSRRAP